MSGNTDFWHNDRFTQTDHPFPGNNLFGANRRRSKPDKTPVIESPNRLRKAGGTLVTVGDVCEFITQTLTQTPGAPPLWLRLEPRCDMVNGKSKACTFSTIKDDEVVAQ